MGGVIQDLRSAWRQVRQAPGFAAVAILTVALGIGATTAVFSVVDQLLLRPLDYPEPERVVRLLEFHQDGSGRGTISAPNFSDWMAEASVFEAGALYDEYRPTLVVEGEAFKVEAASVGASFFDVLGVQPVVGRFFLPEEDEPGSRRVVLSQLLWRELFGADPAIVGRTMNLDGFPYTVVGVAPAMEDPRLSFSVAESPRLWRSTPSYFATNGRGGRSFTAIARLERGVTPERAQAELSAVHARLAQEYPETNAGRVVRVAPLMEDLVGDARHVLWVLLSAVGLVLLIACANVANLLLFRAATRTQELGLRAALGASRARVIRQLLMESLVLAILGAAAGMVLALAAVEGLVALAEGQLPRVVNVGLDLRVLGFTAGLALVAALIFGALPALQATRMDLQRALGEGRQGRTTQKQGRLRTAMVAAQVGLAVVVMLGAGVLARSLLRLQKVDPGIAAEQVAVLRTDPPTDPYDPFDDQGRVALLALYDRLTDRLAGLPEIRAVGITDLLPLSGSFNGNAFAIVGRPPPPPGELPSAESRAVSAGYFEAMDIPVLDGRGIRPSDRQRSERVALVNRSFAELHFPRGDAVGAQIQILDPDAPPARIVGIVGDVTQFSLDRGAEPVVYVPIAQAPGWMQGEPWIVLRTAGDPASALAAARAAIGEIEPRAPVYAARPMSAVIAETLSRPRFRTLLLVAFAGVALLLAVTGVYGMVAYTVARRRPELGVRVALGADSRRILEHVIGQGIRPVVLGVGIGVLAGLPAMRMLGGFLYGVSPIDPLTFVAVPTALIGVALLAAGLPARRAAATDPVDALRAE